MDFTKKLAFFAFSFFILFLFVWALYLPKENLEEKALKTLESQKERADVSFKGVIFSEALGSKNFWELNATSAVLNKDTGLTEIKEVKGVFFNKNKPSLYFISPSAQWQMKSKEIHLESPIGYDLKKFAFLKKLHPGFKNKSFGEQSKLIQQNENRGPGYWFRSNYLDWKLLTQKVSCKDGIILKGKDFSIYSQNLEGDLTPFLDGIKQKVMQKVMLVFEKPRE